MKWYETNPARFEAEKRLLAQHHPGTKIIIQGGQVKLTKKIRTKKNTYLIEGTFPKGYPYSPVCVKVIEPKLKSGVPHRYCDGRLCLHSGCDVGPETTAKIILDWTVQWLLTYEKWLDGERWPKNNQK